MNLIEQLGGYEETKKHLDSCWCDDDNKAYLLEKLLEYRRQKNIFEVEDFIVLCGSCAEWSDDVLTIKDVRSNTVVTENFDFVFKFGSYRHATTEEIKAGRRLP